MRQTDADVIRVCKVDGVSRKSSVRCELHSGEQTAGVELLDQMEGLYGTVQVAADKYAMRQYSDGNPHPDRMRVPEALGLRIDRDEQNVAALEFRQPGTMWLGKSLSPARQDALAAVLAAMLINTRR